MMHMSGVVAVDWGTLPAWVSSVSSALALLFAATAAVIARRTFLIQSEQHQVNAEDRGARAAVERAAQASLVSIWWGESTALPGEPRNWGAYIRNSSWAPVYQVHVAFVRVGGGTPFAKIDLPLVPPGDGAEFHPAPIQEQCRARLTFTDAKGVRWIRDEYGRLTPLEPKLAIWAGEDIAGVLGKFQRDFQSAFGVTVTFEINNDLNSLREIFLARARGGEDVDVLVGPHDWVGELAVQGAVLPAVVSSEQRATFVDWTTKVLSVGGQLYGIPATMDTVVLLRNTDLVPDPPETFEDLLAMGRELKERGVVSEAIAVAVGAAGDPYHIWPLFTSAGGWLFPQRADGTFDPTVVGFAESESVAALERIAELGEAGAGVLRREIDGPVAHRLFLESRTPFVFGMYGMLSAARRAGLRVAAGSVPPFRDGVAAKPFVSVNGFFMAPYGRNRMIAEDLISDYLTRLDVMSEVSAQMAAPVARRDASGLLDPAIDALYQACAAGSPMPAFPEMAAVWRLLARAEVDVIVGDDPATVADRTARSITNELRGYP
jgi:maltose-binding protein MalE